MRAVLQRVSQASVQVNNQVVGQIEVGWLVLLGVAQGDQDPEADQLAEKVVNLRAFEDEAGKMNRAVGEVGGSVLVVSQFTLLGDCERVADPALAEPPNPSRPNGFTFGSSIRSGSEAPPLPQGSFGPR